ncbi:MAG: MarR family transcriptional regulator [Dehalococcoidales bacterium]|nr:MarR family transcriptional regulator [Dehalococcoidales bacterium]MDD5605303.1 MarR family transcriptional regulator [Dehalococcoidales bacterium]MDX9985838.1 MarR family transcriptional regulator [Dehalococcoidales bacterium]NLE89844.1 MarR family transcriptional regulator [Dehalococcoidales bacterium]
MDKEELINQAIGFHEQIYGLLNEYSYEDWLSLDLSIGQLKSLIYIRYRGKASHSELSKILNVTPSVVTGIIDRLESSGLVSRQVDEADRRVHWLTLTDQGEDLFNRFDLNSKNEISQVLSALSENELEALVNSFSCFLAAFKRHMDKTNRAIEYRDIA